MDAAALQELSSMEGALFSTGYTFDPLQLGMKWKELGVPESA